MIHWLGNALVLALHDRQIAEHGGSPGLRDEALLESALARPQQLYAYTDPVPDLASLAAALAYGLARSHPFVDGNKRVAAVSCETSIELNGGQLEARDPDLFVQYFALAAGKLSETDFAAWIRDRLRLQDSRAVHASRPPHPARTPRPRRTAARRKARKALGRP